MTKPTSFFPLSENDTECALPIIGISGDSGTGKSTFIASIAKQPRLNKDGQENDPVTLIFDTEESYPTLKSQYALDVVDVFSLIKNLPEEIRKNKPQDHQLFLAYESFFKGGHEFDDMLKRFNAGHYRVIAIDSASKLFAGTQLDLIANPTKMGVYGMGYGGTVGVSTSWADASRWWGNELQRLGEKASDCVVLSQHRKVDFKTKKTADRGANVLDRYSLKLILFKESDVEEAKAAGIKPCRFGLVEKSRINYTIFYDEAGNELEEPAIAPRLPKLIIPKKGQSFVAVIREYLKNPLPDYGKLNDVDPSILKAPEVPLAEEEIAQTFQLAVKDEKSKMVKALIAERWFVTIPEIANAITLLGLTADANDLTKIDGVKEKLIEYSKSLKPYLEI